MEGTSSGEPGVGVEAGHFTPAGMVRTVGVGWRPQPGTTGFRKASRRQFLTPDRTTSVTRAPLPSIPTVQPAPSIDGVPTQLDRHLPSTRSIRPHGDNSARHKVHLTGLAKARCLAGRTMRAAWAAHLGRRLPAVLSRAGATPGVVAGSWPRSDARPASHSGRETPWQEKHRLHRGRHRPCHHHSHAPQLLTPQHQHHPEPSASEARHRKRGAGPPSQQPLIVGAASDGRRPEG